MVWPFHRKSNEFHRKWDNLTQNLRFSFSSIKDDFHRVGDWIRHFNQKQSEHDERLERIERKLNVLLEEKDIEFERVQSFNRSSGPFMNVQSPDFEEKSSFQQQNLTPIQKKVIMLMLGLGVPMDYETIAKKLELNIVTVRRHINDIKRAGFDIREKKDTVTQRKVFFVGSEGKKIVVGTKRAKKRVKR